jgi:hypothetical protein
MFQFCDTIYIYIYIYIERERERERGGGEREGIWSQNMSNINLNEVNHIQAE